METFTKERARKLLFVLKAEGIRSLVLGGGEPLEWPHGTFSLAEEARREGFLVQLGTNGILLPSGFEKSSSIDRYVLPLDGASAEIHNSLRFWRDNHFQIVMDRLNKLKSVGKSTTISTVVTKKNYRDLRSIFQMLLALNRPSPFLHAWHLYRFIPEGQKGRANGPNLFLKKEEYNRVTETLRSEESEFKVFKRSDMLKSITVEFFWIEAGKIHSQLGERRRVVEV